MRRTLFATLLLMALAAPSCRHRHASTEAPRLKVEVATAVADSMTMRYDFITHLKSDYDVVVEPRVSGYLRSKHYAPGMPVRKGQLLFRIESDLLNATLQAARASLAAAEAEVVEARNNYERALPLVELSAISLAQMDQYRAAYSSAQAAVESARQQLQNARLQASYADIRSPIDGIAAWSAAHEGDYVGPGSEFTTLTTISNTDTLTAEIAIPTTLYLEYAGRGASYANRDLLSEVTLQLADGSTYEYRGLYDYTRGDISPTSGTITLVVRFPNPDKRLKVGEYARIETGVGPRRLRVTIPQQAVNRTQGIESVWVMRSDSSVEYRPIRTGQSIGSRWVIDEGLTAGERVVVTGSQKMRSGAKVIPQNSEQ